MWTSNACTPEAIPPGVATTLNDILKGDVMSPEGTGTRAAVPGVDIAGKTGTSQNNWSVAFVGYTPQYVASVMVLNPKANQDVGGFGGNKPATIWHDAMAPILTGQPAVPFPPDDKSLGWERGTAVSKEWDAAVTEAALEMAAYVIKFHEQLAGIDPKTPLDKRGPKLKNSTPLPKIEGYPDVPQAAPRNWPHERVNGDSLAFNKSRATRRACVPG